MCGATLDRPLRPAISQQSVNQSRCKRITTSNAVENLEVLPHGCFVKLAVRVTNRTPVVDRRGLCISQRRSDDIEVWKLGNSAFDHAEETAHVEFRVMLVLAVDFESKRGREVLFVTKHHINQRRQFAVHINRLLLTANRL